MGWVTHFIIQPLGLIYRGKKNRFILQLAENDIFSISIYNLNQLILLFITQVILTFQCHLLEEPTTFYIMISKKQ